jgi:hypothetical protein
VLGSGKTTLASQITVAAARAGRRVLILTELSESTSKLVSHLGTFTSALLTGSLGPARRCSRCISRARGYGRVRPSFP